MVELPGRKGVSGNLSMLMSFPKRIRLFALWARSSKPQRVVVLGL